MHPKSLAQNMPSCYHTRRVETLQGTSVQWSVTRRSHYEVSSFSPRTSPATVSSRAPGKIILSGEQFVVLGAPAVAMAVNLYSEIDVRPSQSGEIEVTADIPLHLVSDADKGASAANNQELLEQ